MQIEILDFGITHAGLEVVADIDGREYEMAIGLAHACRALESIGEFQIDGKIFFSRNDPRERVNIWQERRDPMTGEPEEFTRLCFAFDLVSEVAPGVLPEIVADVWQIPQERDLYFKEVITETVAA